MLGIQIVSTRAIKLRVLTQFRLNSSITSKYSPNLLDLRVGQIIDIKRHENADKAYVSKVLLESPKEEEEPKYLQVCSGLVDYIPMNELLNKKIVILKNLKPSKMRGIESQAMLLAASKEIKDEESVSYKVEIVNPPKGSEINDKLVFTGIEYSNENGSDLKNIKSKIWQELSKSLKTNDKGEIIFGSDEHKLVKLTDNSVSEAYVKELFNSTVS